MAAFAALPALAAPFGPVQPRYGLHRPYVEAHAGYDRRNTRLSTSLFDRGRYESTYALSRIGWAFNPRLEGWIYAGTANLDVENRPDIVNSTQSFFDGNLKPAYGGGFSAILFGSDTWHVAGSLSGLAHQRHGGSWGAGAVAATDIDFREWQAGVQFQKPLWRWALPYVGVSYSDARVIYHRVNGNYMNQVWEAEETLGAYGGLGVRLGDRISGYAEVRATDEYSYSGGFRYQFGVKRKPAPVATPDTGAVK